MRRMLRLTVLSAAVLMGAEEGSCGEGGGVDPVAVCPVDSDADGDGSKSVECGGDDCDDNDARRFPGNAEICDVDHHDEDCDPSTFGVRDADGDDFPDARCCNSTHDGSLRCGSDCDDLDNEVHPIAPDVCDGVDNDCDGYPDDESQVSLFLDADGDGHGVGPAALVCAGTQGYSTLSNDCDDKDVGLYPGMLRCTAKIGEYELCQDDGTWMIGYCNNGQQGQCIPQPGGWGICL